MARPFRLQAVARVRERQRDAKRTRLAEGLRAVETVIQRQEELAQMLDTLNRQRRAALIDGASTAERLLDAGRYELALRSEQRVLADQRQQVEAEVERRRGELAEADRQVKALELLRQRNEQAERRASRRREARRLDEIATQRARPAT